MLSYAVWTLRTAIDENFVAHARQLIVIGQKKTNLAGEVSGKNWVGGYVRPSALAGTTYHVVPEAPSQSLRRPNHVKNVGDRNPEPGVQMCEFHLYRSYAESARLPVV